MNRTIRYVIHRLLKFYSVIILVILGGTVVYALSNGLDMPIVLYIIDTIAALVMCMILSAMCGRYTRIITQEINLQEVEALKKYLEKSQFVEDIKNEYCWMKMPQFLLKNVKVIIIESGDKAVISIPHFLTEWQHKVKG